MEASECASSANTVQRPRYRNHASAVRAFCVSASVPSLLIARVMDVSRTPKGVEGYIGLFYYDLGATLAVRCFPYRTHAVHEGNLTKVEFNTRYSTPGSFSDDVFQLQEGFWWR